MSRPDRQDGAEAPKTLRRLRVRTPHLVTVAVGLLCSLLAAGAAPVLSPPGVPFSAERANASGIGDMVIPDRAPSRALYGVDGPVDTPGAPQPTPGQTLLASNPAASPTPLSPVVSSLASDGIPVVASLAYHHAADLANQRTLTCAIPWTLLAAIGRVESDHGRFAGSVLLANGVSTPRIIGIALNGVGTGLVLDTDHGILDGDPVFDHAVGPMQFIPSTWAYYATDGNGDGVSDPFNIYDAAAGAGKYLCNAGANLRTRSGKIQAVLAYNHSNTYVATVLALEASYAGSPIILTPAPLTHMLKTAALPPVNPGVPQAISPRLVPQRVHISTPPPAAPPISKPRTTPTPSPTPTDVPSGSLTGVQDIDLAAVTEAEKLVHDLYSAFADTYGTPAFVQITKDETLRLAQARALMKRYAIADPTAGRAVGDFATASTQQLYNQLLTEGTASVDAADAAVVTLDARNSTDLKAATVGLTAPDVLQMYNDLLAATRRRLVMFGGGLSTA